MSGCHIKQKLPRENASLHLCLGYHANNQCTYSCAKTEHCCLQSQYQNGFPVVHSYGKLFLVWRSLLSRMLRLISFLPMLQWWRSEDDWASILEDLQDLTSNTDRLQIRFLSLEFWSAHLDLKVQEQDLDNSLGNSESMNFQPTYHWLLMRYRGLK